MKRTNSVIIGFAFSSVASMAWAQPTVLCDGQPCESGICAHATHLGHSGEYCVRALVPFMNIMTDTPKDTPQKGSPLLIRVPHATPETAAKIRKLLEQP